MAEEATNLHKRLAMGASGSIASASGKGAIQKYAKGGSVMPEAGVANLPPKGDRKPESGGPFGKIATMKKGGKAKQIGYSIAIAIPVKRSAGRGR
jgi:hypothetical protein